MELKNLARIKRLRGQAQSLKTFFTRYRKITSEPQCDKYGWGFNGDGRFTNFGPIKIFFSSHRGYYGNSSCSTIGLTVTQEDAQMYLVKALDKHAATLFDTMAEMMEADAKAMKNAASEEISKANELLAELDKPDEPENEHKQELTA